MKKILLTVGIAITSTCLDAYAKQIRHQPHEYKAEHVQLGETDRPPALPHDEGRRGQHMNPPPDGEEGHGRRMGQPPDGEEGRGHRKGLQRKSKKGRGHRKGMKRDGADDRGPRVE